VLSVEGGGLVEGKGAAAHGAAVKDVELAARDGAGD